MNENLGTLFFAFRAQISQWKQDLAAMDREVAQYRAKWETPVRMGMASGGGAGGGSGTATVSTGTGAGGLNVAGTSNGDVTWRLADKVDRFQQSTGGSSGVDAARNRISDHNYHVQSVRQSLEMQNRIDDHQRSMDQARREDAAWGPIRRAEARQQPGSDGNKWGWNTKIPIQALVRGTVYGLVVDAVAGMAANESKYAQNVALAGNNQGSLARAEIQRLTGGLASVPLIGGILSNAASIFTNPIETELTLTGRRSAFGDRREQMGLSIAYRGAASRAASFGSLSFGRQAAESELQFRRDRSALAQEREALYAQRVTLPESPGAMQTGLNFVLGRGAGQALDYLAGNRYGSNIASNRAASAAFINETAAQQSIIAGEKSRREAQLGVDFNYAYSMTAADVSRKQHENAMRPVAGFAISQAYGAMADVDRFRAESEGKTSVELARDRAMLNLSIQNRMADAGGMLKGIQENLLYGRGQQYDPYFESPLAFADRSPEPVSEQIKQLVELMKQLVDLQKGLPNYGGQ